MGIYLRQQAMLSSKNIKMPKMGQIIIVSEVQPFSLSHFENMFVGLFQTFIGELLLPAIAIYAKNN